MAGSQEGLPVAVIGAGPVGLAAAAHLVRRGLEPLVLEASDGPGGTIRCWRHVRMFSPWRYNVDAASAALLEAEGWTRPPGAELPTGGDLLARYLEPLAATAALSGRVRYGVRVVSVTRDGFDKVRTRGRDAAPFVLRLRRRDGGEAEVRARAVIDASGVYDQPNPLGAGGVPAPGEAELGDRIAYGIPDVLGADRASYAGRSVAVVGSGHSAANVLLDLAALAEEEPGTSVLWVLRKTRVEDAYGGGELDLLPARGALGLGLRELVEGGGMQVAAEFRASAVRRDGDGGVVLSGDWRGRSAELPAVHRVVVATGARPSLGMLRELRLGLDPALECTAALAPLIDPNVHSCGTVRPHGERELRHPEPGLYIAGVKSYGRAPTFLLITGYEQVRSVVAALAGDFAAAEAVELDLPETGVCGVDLQAEEGGDAGAAIGPGAGAPPATGGVRGGGCCGAPAGPAPGGRAALPIYIERPARPAASANSPEPRTDAAGDDCCGCGEAA